MFMCGALWMADAMEMMLLSFLLPELKKEWERKKRTSSAA